MYDSKVLAEVTQYCDRALIDGNIQYGDDYLHKNLGTDLYEEARDIVNYGRLFMMRVRELENVMNLEGSVVKFFNEKDTKDLEFMRKSITDILKERGKDE